MKKILAISFKGTRGMMITGGVGVSVGSFILVFFLGLVSGLQRAVNTKIFPEEYLEISLPQSRFLEAVSLMGKARGGKPLITESEMGSLKNLDGVVGVFPRLKFKFPSKMWGGEEIFGFEGGTDIVGDGVACQLLSDWDGNRLFKDFYPSDSLRVCRRDSDCRLRECCWIKEGSKSGYCRHPVPFVISGKLVGIYNSIIAPAHNLKRMPAGLLQKMRGMKLNMMVGRSYQGRANKGVPERLCAEFAGISQRAIDIGITVPIEYARRWNLEYSPGYTEGGFTSLVIKIADRSKLGRIIQEVKSRGFVLTSRGKEEVGFLLGLLNGIFIAISLLVIFVATISISHIFSTIVTERKKEIALMRALGAPRRLIVRSFLFQGFAVGVVGGGAGIIIAILFSFLADFVASSIFPGFPFKPDSFFKFKFWIVTFAIFLSLASSMVGAYFPARRAAEGNPMAALN